MKLGVYVDMNGNLYVIERRFSTKNIYYEFIIEEGQGYIYFENEINKLFSTFEYLGEL